MNKPQLILIHGAGCDKRVWPENLLHSSDVIVHALDLPGHGDDPSQSKIKIEDYVSFILSYIEQKKIEKPVLCGHSMGGAIAMSLALSHPEKISKLILVGTGARLQVAPMFMKILKMKGMFRLAMAVSLQTALYKKASAAVRKTVKDMLITSGQDVLYGDLSACREFDMMKELERINIPTLILCGRHDKLTPVKYSRYLHDHIKGSEIKMLEDVGHFLSLENPEEFSRLVLDWVEMVAFQGG